MGIIIPMERIVKKLWNSEFVSREAVYQTLTEYYHHTTEGMHSALREAISRVPAADVRPVVLCGECKYWKLSKIDSSFHVCTYVCGTTFVRKAEDFCSRGAKREES